MTTEELLIHELAQRAGISVRTIRYYIEEGLLPQPAYQGKYSYYTLSYLDRLELIRKLKESFLPLREIREIMGSLTDAQVRRKLKEMPLSSPKLSLEQLPSQPAPKPGAKALDYINRLMEDQTKYRSKETVAQPPTSHLRGLESPGAPGHRIQFQAPTNAKETWLHIQLAPGVELHLRQPLEPDTQMQVDQLINLAQNIFLVEP